MFRDLFNLAVLALAVAAYRKADLAMTETERQKELVGRFFTATNKVADKLKEVKDIVAGALEDEAEQKKVNDLLEGGIAELETLGADPTNPVPSEPPVPPA